MYYVCFRKVFLKYCHKTGVKGVKKGSQRYSEKDNGNRICGKM